jgi:predicted ABC-type ATPase
MTAIVQQQSRFLMADQPPKVVILAGPNGAGKSTSAAKLLLGALSVDEFVNADTIAQGLSAFAPDRVALEAGRVMLRRIKELAAARADFGFETTLASRSYAPWLKKLQAAGYEVHLLFLWLPSADMAAARVADRVRAGGHDVPEPTIRRRYAAGLKNLWTLYLPLANSWKVIDNTRRCYPRLIAAGLADSPAEIYLESAWRRIMVTER